MRLWQFKFSMVFMILFILNHEGNRWVQWKCGRRQLVANVLSKPSFFDVVKCLPTTQLCRVATRSIRNGFLRELHLRIGLGELHLHIKFGNSCMPRTIFNQKIKKRVSTRQTVILFLVEGEGRLMVLRLCIENLGLISNVNDFQMMGRVFSLTCY